MPTDFAPGSAPAAVPFFAGATMLDAEKLHVYHLAVQFQALAARLVPRQRGVLLATLRDQLDRASISIVLNIAEGAGRFSPPDKARFYAIARGSATECGALLDLLVTRGLIGRPLYGEARTLIVRIVRCSLSSVRGWRRGMSRASRRSAVVALATVIQLRRLANPGVAK